MKIAIGMIMQETNSFSTIKTELDDFRYSALCPLLEGPKLVEQHRGIPSELSGFIDVCEKNDVEIIPTIAAFAVPSGTVVPLAFERLKARLFDKLKNLKDLDGILLALHGAMATDTEDDAEGEILSEIRETFGNDTYIGCSLDVHANVTQKMVANADILISYVTHDDHEQIGALAAEKLIYCIRNRIHPRVSLTKVPIIMADFRNLRLRDSIDAAHHEAGILSISAFSCNGWSDVAEYGSAVVAISQGAKEQGERVCREIANVMWETRSPWPDTERLSVPAVMDQTAERIKRIDGPPAVCSELGDVTGGGAAGDSVAFVDVLLRKRIRSIASILYDPEAVEKAFLAGEGATIEVPIGGRYDYEGAYPYPFSGKVRRLYDGNYVLTGIPYGGITACLGKTALVGFDDVDLVLMSKRAYPHGSAIFNTLGLDVSSKKVITVKAVPSLDFPIWDYWKTETPGWCNHRFEEVPYVKINRPMWPLDNFEFRATS